MDIYSIMVMDKTLSSGEMSWKFREIENQKMQNTNTHQEK